MDLVKSGFLFFLLWSSIIVEGQSHDWTRTNPGGGGAFSTVGAGITGIIFAGSDLSGAYRSLDNGASWDVIGSYRGMDETHVSGLGFHRTNGDIIFIGTENGIFKSTDGGESVQRVLRGGYITDIEFSTSAPSTGYASYHPQFDSNQGVIYRTIDNGETWNQVSTNLPPGLRILKLLVNPLDVKIVYALSGNGRFACGPANVFRSDDAGATWQNLSAALPSVLDVALAASNPSVVYLTTMNASCSEPFYWTDLDGDLYRSTNGGIQWGNAVFNQSGVLWVDPLNEDLVRLIDPREPYPWVPTSGTWASNDGGESFVQTGNVDDWDVFFNDDLFFSYGSSFNGICKTLGENLANATSYFWTNSQWVFGTFDQGNTFQNLFTNEFSGSGWQSRGFDNVNMLDIAISESDPDLIYLGYFDIGLWRTQDGGKSWQSSNANEYTGGWEGKGGNTATILVDPQRSNVVWASMSGNQNGQPPTYLLKNESTGSQDGWILANTGLPNEEIMGLSLDRHSDPSSRTLYVTSLGDVYKSTNDGATWSRVFDCNGCRYTEVDIENPQLVYAGGDAGLWRSEDAGSNWQDVSHTDMKSSPGTNFWDRNFDGVFGLQTDPNRSGWVYVAALGTGKGLYVSKDRGTNWTKLLTDDHLRRVAVMPNNSDVLYATSSSAFEAGGYEPSSSGIWFSMDAGKTWSQQNQNMAYPFALAVKVDSRQAPNVFVGSPGTGFQKSAVPLTTSAHIVGNSNAIEIYPNPFEDQIVLTGDLAGYSIQVIDANGSVLKSLGSQSDTQVIHLDNLPSGVYFLNLKHNQQDHLEITKILKD